MVTPADDPQGVGLAGKLTAQSKRLDAASTNVQNAVSYLQSSDGLMGSMSRMVTRMSELSILAKDVMKNGGDIALYQTEFAKIQEQLRVTIGGSTAEIGGTTAITKPLGTFNGIVLFGANTAGITTAVGANTNESITISETNLRDGAMVELFKQDNAGNFTLSVTDPTALTKINAGLQDLADERATVGAFSRRFDLVGATLTKRSEEITKSISGIQDVDVATESTRLAKYQALTQSASTMVVQANSSSDAVLQMLRGI
jgi:flagellin